MLGDQASSQTSDSLSTTTDNKSHPHQHTTASFPTSHSRLPDQLWNISALAVRSPWPNSSERRSLARHSRLLPGTQGGVRHIFCDNGTADFDLHRYSDLQPVGMGAFGLVWCDLPLYDFSPMTFTDIIPQLCKRSAYRPKCCG